MLEALFILLLGLTPSLFSLWLLRQADARAQERFRLAVESVASRTLPPLRLDPEQQYVEGLGFIIGDLTCRYNARSSYVRCAVNPLGPCSGCTQYEPTEVE
ncbi:MAG TPA: hypothetical protein IGS37_08560 [Synechococcales cyanobacterium M55_K2018_004]|nr:hypothetical protein [Synechococcales cyanobacterium M55_K2018_004]